MMTDCKNHDNILWLFKLWLIVIIMIQCVWYLASGYTILLYIAIKNTMPGVCMNNSPVIVVKLQAASQCDARCPSALWTNDGHPQQCNYNTRKLI